MNAVTLHRLRRALLGLGWIAVLLAPFVTHAALATGRFATTATVLALGQLGVLGTLAVRGLRGWRRGMAGGAFAALLLLVAVRLLRPDWVGPAGLIAASGFSHAVIYGSLFLLFGRSLAPGRTDLITGLATRLRGSLTPSMLRYTRNVTKAWCAFFAGQIAVSLVLLAAAPHAVWSLFVNVLDGPSVILMFAGEYAIRRWRFRDYRHISPVETFRTFARNRAAGP